MTEIKPRSFAPESAPSEVTADEPSFARLAGSLGLGLTVIGILALWMNASKPRLIGPTTAVFITLIGAAAMLYHAARDPDRLVRRAYIALGIVALGIGTVLCLLKQPTIGAQFLPWGVVGLFTGLFFVLGAGRHENEAPWPNVMAGILTLLGLGGTLTGLIGVYLWPEQVPLLAGVAVIGMIFWWAAIGRWGSDSDYGHRLGQLLTVVAAIALAIGLGRSVVAGFGVERFLVPRGLVLTILGTIGAMLGFGLCSDRAIVAMTRRELGAYFCTPIAYLVLFGNTIIGWINYLMFVDGLMSEARVTQVVFEPIVQNYLVNIFPIIVPMIVIPMITMRLISEERRSGTVEVLLSAPVSEWQVVMSKFTAALIYFLILFLPWGLFLIPVAYMGREGFDFAPLLGFLLALLCTGSAFVATGLFCSSITKNQIIAAVLAFAAMMLYFALPFSLQWIGVASTLRTTIIQLSFMQVWNSSISGNLNLQQLFTYLSITVFWLFLTTKVLESAEVELSMAAETNTGGVVGWLAHSRSGSGRVMLLLAVLFAAGAAYFFWLAAPWAQQIVATDSVGLTLALWLAACALAFVIGGVRLLGSDPPNDHRDSAARITLLSLAGVIGGATFLFGLTLLYQWGEIVSKLLRENDRTDAWKVFLALLTIISGLAVMFLGLQAVRADERKAAGIRRAIYGFNAFLTGFLLLAVLIVANVIVTLKFPGVIDTTKAGVYSISDRSKQILKDVDKPVRIVLIMGASDASYPDMQSLLLICQQYNPKLKVEYLDQMQNTRFRELAKTFPQISEQTTGMLIIYGDEKSENATFVRARDLVSEEFDPRSGSSPKRKFLGEVKLMSELSFLAGGKDKPIVYFTQGSGEPEINDQSGRMGIGRVTEKLQRRNFDVRPLKLDPLNVTIPDDAKIIVVVSPKQTMPPNAVDALKSFLDKGGKLVALLDVPEANRTDKEMPATGMEGLLSGYGVEVTKEQIQTIPLRHLELSSTDEVLARISPAAESTSLAAPFRNMSMQFFSCRVIRASANPAGQTPFRATPLLVTLPVDQVPVWTETDLQVNGMQTARTIASDRSVAAQRLAKEPLPFAAMVSQTPRSLPGSPPGVETPKMVVIGDATFISNMIGGQRGEASSVLFDLFAGTLDWLRERPSNIGIAERNSATFELNPETQLKETQIKFLPLLVSVIVVIGLGLGVWLVRRQ